MAIIVNLDVMMARRKMSLGELAQKVDITMANLSILKNNKARAVRFSTLEAICKALDCQPGDILEFVPDGGGSAMKFVKRHRALAVGLILVLALWGWRTWDGHFTPERWADTPISQRGKLVDSLLEQYGGLVGHVPGGSGGPAGG